MTLTKAEIVKALTERVREGDGDQPVVGDNPRGDTDGTDERAWAGNWRQMKSPTWTADGSKLVFSWQNGGQLDAIDRRINLKDAFIQGDKVDIPDRARGVEVKDGILKYTLPADAYWNLKEVDLSTGQLTDLPSERHSYGPTGHPTQANQVVFRGDRGIALHDLETGIEVAPQYLSQEGKFDFKLINNKQYLLIIQGDEFFRVEEIFFLDGDMELNMVTESITSRLKFESIEFDNGSAELKTSMYIDLDKLSDFLLDNPDFKLKISGHTDSDGGYDFNMDLSNERAKAISEYIIYFGNISAARIETFGFGSSQPIVEEKTEADKALNRRVEFELYRPSQEELNKMRQEIQEEEEDEW